MIGWTFCCIYNGFKCRTVNGLCFSEFDVSFKSLVVWVGFQNVSDSFRVSISCSKSMLKNTVDCRYAYVFTITTFQPLYGAMRCKTSSLLISCIAETQTDTWHKASRILHRAAQRCAQVIRNNLKSYNWNNSLVKNTHLFCMARYLLSSLRSHDPDSGQWQLRSLFMGLRLTSLLHQERFGKDLNNIIDIFMENNRKEN